MGFGLMLCGYFILTLMSFGIADYSFATYIIGGFVAVNAAYRLKDYCPRFSLIIAAGGIYILLGLINVVSFLDELFLWNLFPTEGGFFTALDRIAFFGELFFHVVLLWSVMTIASDVEEKKIQSAAVRNLFFIGLCGIGQLVLIFFPGLANFQNQVLSKLLLLLLLICYLLNTWLLYSCYKNICPEGEELGSPMKRSRFAFINKLNDRFEERSTKALKESLEYGRQKQLEREEKRKSKNSKKNKK